MVRKLCLLPVGSFLRALADPEPEVVTRSEATDGEGEEDGSDPEPEAVTRSEAADGEGEEDDEAATATVGTSEVSLCRSFLVNFGLIRALQCICCCSVFVCVLSVSVSVCVRVFPALFFGGGGLARHRGLLASQVRRRA